MLFLSLLGTFLISSLNQIHKMNVTLSWGLIPIVLYFSLYFLLETFNWISKNTSVTWLYVAKQRLAKNLGLNSVDINWVSLNQLRDDDCVIWWTTTEERSGFVNTTGAFILINNSTNGIKRYELKAQASSSQHCYW